MNREVHPLRVIVKALLLFVVFNVVFALVDPPVYQVSVYNSLFPGRVRMPFGEFSDPYVVLMDNVDAMIASHKISVAKDPAEFRVVLIGDSSVWGEGMQADKSISEQWNKLNVQCGGQTVKTYNLGYPHPSVIKDLVILDKAVETNPDLIVWFVTLNTLIPRRVSPFLTANRERVLNMLDRYDIPFEGKNTLIKNVPGLYDKTLMGRRSYLARWMKLQFLGVVWSATNSDIEIQPTKRRDVPSLNVDKDARYRGMEQTNKLKDMIQFDAIRAGYDIAGSTPILIVNEPIFVANGLNSEIRYNDIYPHWAYDQYRAALVEESTQSNWMYLDLWNSVSTKYFSDGLFHLTAKGERLLLEQINPTVETIACR